MCHAVDLPLHVSLRGLQGPQGARGSAVEGDERSTGAGCSFRAQALGCPPPPPGSGCTWSTARATAPSPGQPTPGVVKQDKSSGGSVDTTKTRSGPQRVRMSGGERPIGAAKGKQSDPQGLVPPPPPPLPSAPGPHDRTASGHCALLGPLMWPPYPPDPGLIGTLSDGGCGGVWRRLGKGWTGSVFGEYRGTPIQTVECSASMPLTLHMRVCFYSM